MSFKPTEPGAGQPRQSPAGVRVRTAEIADLPAVVALERATETAPHWAEAEYTAILSPTGGHPTGVQRRLWVAESSDGTIAGFSVGKLLLAGGTVEAELESVAVAECARRQGVGRVLCGAMLAWAREHGAGTVELEVRASSDGAVSLYRALGFTPEGRRPMYYQHPADDALRMIASVR